jgi:hypothetical protein
LFDLGKKQPYYGHTTACKDFSFVDESICLDLLFKNNSKTDMNFIEQISIKDLLPIANVIQCDASKLETHWIRKLKPLLDRHFNERSSLTPFASFLISKEVNVPQEIDWNEIERLLVNPKRSQKYLKKKLIQMIACHDRQNPTELCVPLFQKMKSQRNFQIAYVFDRIRKAEYL